MSTTFSSPGEFTGSLNHQQSEVYSLQPKKNVDQELNLHLISKQPVWFRQETTRKMVRKPRIRPPKNPRDPHFWEKTFQPSFNKLNRAPPEVGQSRAPKRENLSLHRKTPHPQKPVQCSTCDHEPTGWIFALSFWIRPWGFWGKKLIRWIGWCSRFFFPLP